MNIPADSPQFRYGIESELGLINADGQFVDFANTTFEQLDEIIATLPRIESDYPGLRVGDLGIKAKRWYIEGFERFSEEGEYLRTDIKGVEVRTPISDSIKQAVETLTADIQRLAEAAHAKGYLLVATGLNPFKTEFVPTPPLNGYEVAHRSSPEEQTAYIHMLTYGPDVSFSHPDLTDEQIIDIGRKLTAYSPYIAPYSYSSPFFEGSLWGGLSRRTFYRTGARPAALVFLHDNANLLTTNPTLTEPARIPAEAGRIEYKAFDATADPKRFSAYLALVKGIALSTELPDRLDTPDRELHQLSARYGFKDDKIWEQAKLVFAAAKHALPPAEQSLLDPLEKDLNGRLTPADRMIEQYQAKADIITILENPHGL